MLTLADVLEALTGVRPPLEEVRIPEASVDSRQVVAGGLFVAMPGEHADGHDFVADAFRRGAAFALIQREIGGDVATLDLRPGRVPPPLPFPPPPLCLRVENSLAALQMLARFRRRQMRALRVVGVTGSVGKSTTKEVIAEVLGRRFRTLKNPGNLNNEIGLPLTLLQLEDGHECAVLEMGFYVPGEIAFLCDLALPQVGVLTNIGTVHAERAGSQEAIFRGKSELVQALPPAPDGVAVLNNDDPWVRKMAEKTRARVVFYGLTREADLWADEIEGRGLEGIRFRLHIGEAVHPVTSPMIGRHSVETALRAAAVGLALGLSVDEIRDGLAQARPQLRLAVKRAAGGALLIDDSYNAAPESMLAALNLLSELPGRKVAVLGDMLELGPYERQGHELVGLRAAQVADLLLTLGERARMIAESARRGGMKRTDVLEFARAEPLIDWLRAHLSAGDVVLIKGSHGLRMDRIVGALEANG